MGAYARSISTIWLVMTPLIGVSFVMVLFVRKYSLKRTVVRQGDAKKDEPITDVEKGAVAEGETPTPTAEEDDSTVKRSIEEKERSEEASGSTEKTEA
ncbi:hypothetical protein C0991_003929 [Blastosporella zonata]|nr:hypothetical protein C0991_003929 [Blastosporella zonata]